MSTPPSDTTPEAREVQLRLLRRLSIAERAQRVSDLTLTANMLALEGLRARHPDATERELFLRLAVARLGPDLVERAYGWRAPADGA